MIPEWANIVAPVSAALLGVVVAGAVNYWFSNRRERQQLQLETEGAAVMLLAEIERIEYRFGTAIQDQAPESPKQDFNISFYHSLQPRLGLVFRPQTINALVQLYQSVEQLETLSDAYNRSGVEQDLNADRWKNEVQRAYLIYQLRSKMRLTKKYLGRVTGKKMRTRRMTEFMPLGLGETVANNQLRPAKLSAGLLITPRL